MLILIKTINFITITIDLVNKIKYENIKNNKNRRKHNK